jgi:hypothetical protein
MVGDLPASREIKTGPVSREGAKTRSTDEAKTILADLSPTCGLRCWLANARQVGQGPQVSRPSLGFSLHAAEEIRGTLLTLIWSRSFLESLTEKIK